MDKTNELGGPGPKQELMRKIAEHYPAIDLRALELISQIKTVAKLHTALTSHGLAKCELTEARMYLLCSLFLHEKSGDPPMSPSAISDKLEITRATVTSLLDGLQESDFVVRESSDEDRRTILIRVTDKSRNLIDSLMSQGMPKLDAAMAFLSINERDSLIVALRQIAVNLENSLD